MELSATRSGLGPLKGDWTNPGRTSPSQIISHNESPKADLFPEVGDDLLGVRDDALVRCLKCREGPWKHIRAEVMSNPQFTLLILLLKLSPKNCRVGFLSGTLENACVGEFHGPI